MKKRKLFTAIAIFIVASVLAFTLSAQGSPTPEPLADYWVTAEAGQGGTISGGSGFAYPGSSWYFTITPNQGYQILDVKDNGVSKGAISSYNLTITRHDVNHLIEATFTLNTTSPNSSQAQTPTPSVPEIPSITSPNSSQTQTPTPSVPEIHSIIFIIVPLIAAIIGTSLFRRNRYFSG